MTSELKALSDERDAILRRVVDALREWEQQFMPAMGVEATVGHVRWGRLRGSGYRLQVVRKKALGHNVEEETLSIFDANIEERITALKLLPDLLQLVTSELRTQVEVIRKSAKSVKGLALEAPKKRLDA
jgi:hypothetical protein